MKALKGILGNLFGYDGNVVIGDVSVDCSLYEDHTIEAELTNHPVEEGSDITDHYQKQPDQVTITGIISPISLGTTFPGQTLVNSVKSLIKGSDPVKEAWATFERYYDDKEIINIATEHKNYTSMVLTRVKAVKEPGKSHSLNFELTARKIRIVTTKTTKAIKIPAAVKAATAGKSEGANNQGRKQAQPASEQRKTSVLAQGLDKVAGFF